MSYPGKGPSGGVSSGIEYARKVNPELLKFGFNSDPESGIWGLIEDVIKNNSVVMFVPTPGKRGVYSNYKLSDGDSIEFAQNLNYAGDRSKEEINELLKLNLESGERSIYVLFPYKKDSSDKVRVYKVTTPRNGGISQPVQGATEQVSKAVGDGLSKK